jgi:hypothetical protein
VTTPQLDPALGNFIVKDLTLGVALWSAGEASFTVLINMNAATLDPRRSAADSFVRN